MPSLPRFLAKVTFAGVVINFGFNVVVGVVKFGRRASVAIDGPRNFGDDTVVNAFLIGAITFWLLYPTARRAARAGHVRGGHSGSPILAWVARHHVIAGVGVGVSCSAIFAIPLLRMLKHLGHASLPGGVAVAIKCAFAVGVGAIVSLVVPLPAIAVEPDVSDDPRWCRAPGPEPAWPCDYIDKGGLALTSRAHGVSGTPTWQLLVAGVPDPAHVLQALTDLVTRYPLLATRVQALDGVPPEARRYRYARDPGFDVTRTFATIDLRRDPRPLDAIEAEHQDRHTDLHVDAPVTLTLVIVDDAQCRLMFRQHHALADGRAFIELLGDFAHYLDCAQSGRRPDSEMLAPIEHRGELEALQLPRARRWRWTLAGLGRVAAHRLGHAIAPVVPLPQNLGNDYRGHNGTVHWRVGDDVLAGWNAARKRIGVSLNSLLMAALVVANRRRQLARGGRLGRFAGLMPMETRPREGFRSFANHLASLLLTLDLARDQDPAAIARAIQAQVERQRRTNAPIKRLLAERLLVLAVPLSDLQRIIFDGKHALLNVEFSNLMPLAFPTLQGHGFRVDEVRITTPIVPRTGILVTVIRYNGHACFNFNYKASAATRADAEALLAAFRDVLGETAGAA